MTKIRCGSVLCMHNYGEFCDAEEINISDITCITVNEGRQHFHRCKKYKVDEETQELCDRIMREIT